MKVRTQILTAFLSVAALVGVLSVIAFHQQVVNAKLAAVTEAQRVADVIAEAITFDRPGPVEDLWSDPLALQSYVEPIHRDQHRVLVFLVLWLFSRVVAVLCVVGVL